MPTSTWRSITTILDIIMDLDPRPTRVLDVGIGSGKYGLLCREYLQFWENHLFRHPEKVVIDGIEVFPDYIGDLQRQIYDHIFIGDAANILPQLEYDSYDLVLLIDVIEHFEKAAGQKVLQECQRIAPVLIVSTPRVLVHQPAKWGNPAEEHRALWTRRDLKNCGACWFTIAGTQIAVFARGEYRWQFRPLFRQARALYYRLPLALQLRISTESKFIAPFYRLLTGAR